MRSIKKELEFIIDKTYENLNKENNYKNFKIEFSKKESTKNEKYKDNVLTVFNLYRQEVAIANSCIIALAHHIDFCDRGETKNDKTFLQVYSKLLYKARIFQLLDYVQLINCEDYENQKLIKTALEVCWKKNVVLQIYKTTILEVFNSYKIKAFLKENGFRYNSSYQSWDKEYEIDKVDEITEKLFSLDQAIKLDFRTPHHLVLVFDGYIVVEGNTFKAKEILKKYHFGFSNGKWRKKIKANRYLYEKEIISAVLPKGLGIKIGIEYE